MESGNPNPRNEVKTPLTTVAGLTGSEQSALKAQGIDSVEAYWILMAEHKELSAHGGLPEETIKKIASAMSDAAEAQSETLLNRARSITASRFKQHIPDILTGIVLILALWRIFPWCEASPEAKVVVTAQDGLMPFQLITTSDLAEVNGADDSETFLRAFAGKYTTERKLPGDVLNLSKLSSRSLAAKELEGRQIFTVKLQPTYLMEKPSLPLIVSIMVSPREPSAAGVVIDNVYVLEARSQPDAILAVIAIRSAETQLLAALLAKSDLVAMGPAH